MAPGLAGGLACRCLRDWYGQDDQTDITHSQQGRVITTQRRSRRGTATNLAWAYTAVIHSHSLFHALWENHAGR
jgi:hypothetical protein